MQLESSAFLLDRLEEKILGLSESTNRVEAVLSVMADLRALEGPSAQEPVAVEAIQAFMELLHGVRDACVPLDAKAGGLMLHAVNALRFVRADESLAPASQKVLTDIARVMRALVKKAGARNVSPGVREYREMFFADESQVFSRLAELGRVVCSGADFSQINELFRLFHTAKGNASALGYEDLSQYAHAVEDILQQAHAGGRAIDGRTGAFISLCCQRLCEAVLVLKGKLDQGELSSPELRHAIEEVRAHLLSMKNEPVLKPASGSSHSEAPVPSRERHSLQTKFLLKASLGGRTVYIPSEVVGAVLRNPVVLPVPGGRQGWLGLIRSSGGLVPVVNPDTLIRGAAPKSIVGGSGDFYVCLLDGAMRGRIALPLDDVSGVVEVVELAEILRENATLLDFDAMLKEVG